MKNKYLSTFAVLIVLVFAVNLASAMIVYSVDSDNFQPGSSGEVTIKIKNTLGSTVDDVSLSLDLSNVPFVSTGSSEDSTSELNRGKIETFDFELKASSSAKLGDYDVPYTLTYKLNNTLQTKKGTIGLSIQANPDLVYSATTENPVSNTQGKIILNIINKGLGDAKFVDVTVTPDGYTLLSDDEIYIGTISSDDSQTASFDVSFTGTNPSLNAQVEYRDFNNQKITKVVSLPVTVYTQQRAIELGIIQKSYTLYYAIAVVIILIIWFFWRRSRRKKRMSRAQGR